MILTNTSLLLGPSNSAKYIPCHVPKTNSLSSMKTVTQLPNREAFIWESLFPSICENLSLFGTSWDRWLIISPTTLGSAFSFIVMPAVVWGT